MVKKRDSNMEIVDKLELHYYLRNENHQIDALIRNKCEAELLAIIYEVSSILDVDVKVIAEAVKEGGFREFWKFIQGNTNSITIALLAIQILVTLVPQVLESEKEQLEKELNLLEIEETKLSIKKLQSEIKNSSSSPKLVKKVVKELSNNLKIIKRKSNFYSVLRSYNNVNKISFSLFDVHAKPLSEERSVSKVDFSKFILSSNKLKSQEIETEIEIISPVLKEGRYKWRGIYNELPISFDMLDLDFKDTVLLENIPFRHGTVITCVLKIKRELDEIGDIKIKGYSVTTVISKTDGTQIVETKQGKKYRHIKKYMGNQDDLFE
jgi:hypothetical protein